MVPELIGAPDYTLFQNNFVQCMSALPLHVPEMVRSSNSAIINCFILIKKKQQQNPGNCNILIICTKRHHF